MIKSNFINGKWVEDPNGQQRPVINPATEEVLRTITWATPAQVDAAVSSAAIAFSSWAQTRKNERIDLLDAIADGLSAREEELGHTICTELGSPIDQAITQQARGAIHELRTIASALHGMELGHPFHANNPTQHILHEPIGVAALITPWNWPLAQVTLKLGAALAAGCTTVLKPSEVSPLAAIQLAEVVEEVGAPEGVFNLLQGDGVAVGAPLTRNPLVDMVSFTGSTRAGRAITTAAAQTIKRVVLELGGKSPTIIFADADLESAVDRAVRGCFHNTGQNCNAPTRLLVEGSVYDEVLEHVEKAARTCRVDLPNRPGDHLGPLISQAQMIRVDSYISGAIAEGAQLIVGGNGRPDGLEKGWFVRPTIFANVTECMKVWREEVFGPVLAVMSFEDEEDALRKANDTDYGLAAFIESNDRERCRRVACSLRAGMVHINGASLADGMPFGGMKQSGNGREGGAAGIREFLETKAVAGW